MEQAVQGGAALAQGPGAPVLAVPLEQVVGHEYRRSFGQERAALLQLGGSPRLQGLGGAVLEGGAAHFFLAGHVFRSEFGHAVEEIFFLGEVGLGLGQTRGEHGNFRFPGSYGGPCFAGIDAEEWCAFFHLVSDFDEDLLDHTADQRGDVDVFPKGLDDAACADGGLVRGGGRFHEGRRDRIGFLQTGDEEKHGRDADEGGGDGDIFKHGSWVADEDGDGRGGNRTRSATR